MVHQPSPPSSGGHEESGRNATDQWLKNAGAEGRRWSTPTASRRLIERQVRPAFFLSVNKRSARSKPREVRMRSALDRVYMTAAWLAALMIGLLIMVLCCPSWAGNSASMSGDGCT